MFADEAGEPLLVRQAAQIRLADGGAIDITNYVRFRGGRIERLSGFPRVP